MAMRIPRLLSARDGRDAGSVRSPWRVGVPVVCLLAGLLLGATHGVSRGGEIRRSDAPRLVDLVRSERSAVEQLTTERDQLANTIDSAAAKDESTKWARREALEIFVRLAGPMTPHFAEELWQALGHGSLLADSPWPLAEDALLVDDTVTVAVQLNGKLRGTLQLARDMPKDAAEKAALALPEIERALAGKTPKRVIVRPPRLVNVVV